MKSNRFGLVLGRELRAYFLSPVAYIVTGVFLVVTGWFFFNRFFFYDVADLRELFRLLPLVLSFVVPAATMRLVSEELRSGSYEVASTLPIGTLRIVLGKYVAAVVLVSIMLTPTLSYAIFASRMGDLDWGKAIGGYVGSLFLAGTFCSIGLFSSALTKNQVIAYVIGVAICVFLVTVDEVLVFMPGAITGILQYIGADFHFNNIAKGVIDSRDVVYFSSVTALALFGSQRVLQAKR